MVTLNEAANIMFKLAGAVPEIEAARCCKVRHKLSRCSACVDACPTGALTVEDNEIIVDKTICLGCGACSVACPTQALTSKTSAMRFDNLIEVSLNADSTNSISKEGHGLGYASDAANTTSQYHDVESCSSTAGAKPKVLWLACSKHKLAKLGSEHLECIPCIGALDEAQLIHFAARGIDELDLLCGECTECPLSPASVAFGKTEKRALGLAGEWGLELTIRHHRESPNIESAFPYAGDGYSRRGFFGNMRESLQRSSIAVAESTIEQHLEEQKGKIPWRARLLNEDGTSLKKFNVPRNEAILDDLYAADEQPSPDTTIHPRFAGRIAIDNKLCTGCKLCAFFCTTGALMKLDEAASSKAHPLDSDTANANEDAGPNPSSDDGAPDGQASATQSATHEFRACDCAQCYLCVDACPNHAIKLDPELSVQELFELEPQTI